MTQILRTYYRHIVLSLNKLTRLDLENNNITKIEGLDKLTQLTTLDLSSNNITKIEGLDKLTQLTTFLLTIGTTKIQKKQQRFEVYNDAQTADGAGKTTSTPIDYKTKKIVGAYPVDLIFSSQKDLLIAARRRNRILDHYPPHKYAQTDRKVFIVERIPLLGGLKIINGPLGTTLFSRDKIKQKCPTLYKTENLKKFVDSLNTIYTKGK